MAEIRRIYLRDKDTDEECGKVELTFPCSKERVDEAVANLQRSAGPGHYVDASEFEDAKSRDEL